jgi:hypothetical protein
MKITYEFRVQEKFAPLLFLENDGKRLGDSVRQIKLASDDPRLTRVGKLQQEIHAARKTYFFAGWGIYYRYTRQELLAAQSFQVECATMFEPAGEECGTEYDESTGCPHCGSGARQITPLFLKGQISKTRDIKCTIAGEIIVSKRLVELFQQHGITGAEYRPVYHNHRSPIKSQEWFQLVVPLTNAELVSPTRVGIEPFDDDPEGKCRCPSGDLIGLNLLSELYIKSESRGDSDIVATRQFIGCRRGMLRPEREIIVSPKVWHLINAEKLKGFTIKVAYLV